MGLKRPNESCLYILAYEGGRVPLGLVAEKALPTYFMQLSLLVLSLMYSAQQLYVRATPVQP